MYRTAEEVRCTCNDPFPTDQAVSPCPVHEFDEDE